MRRLKLVIVGLVLGLLAAEAGVRLVEATTGRAYAPDFTAQLDYDTMFVQPHPYVGYVPRPGATNPPGRPQFRVNALGFRGPEIEPVKAAGTLRVACLGGSTTWGSGASSDATTWPAVLERRLNALLPEGGPYRHVEVLNAGMFGYTLLDSFVNLKMRVMPLKPDVVVIYHAINDARVIGRPGFRPDYSHVRGPWTTPLPTTADVLFQWSHLYGLLFHDAGDRLDLNDLVFIEASKGPHSPADRDAGVANFVTTLREAMAVARVDGARTVLCSFAYTVEIETDKDWMHWWGFRIVDRLNAAIRGLVEDEGTPFADVEGALGGRRENFIDPVHLTEAGNALLAQTVARAFVRAGLLAGPPER